MAMEEHPEERQLILLLDGELGVTETAHLQGHVAACQACRARYARLAELTRDIAALHQIASPVRTGQRMWWAAIAAGAAALALLWPSRPLAPAPLAQGGFIALPFSDEALPLDNAPVVRMAVPVEGLRQASFRLSGDYHGRLVLADVVLGLDGQPRAIRFVE
jgi:anti-sigma factor RsiW